MPNLVLGTAQLGMHYGVANKVEQPNTLTAVEIVRAAWEGGIREFDTAQEYGVSEHMLGAAFRELGIRNKAKVVTKLRNNVDLDDEDVVLEAARESIERLGVETLYGLLVHREEMIDAFRGRVPRGLKRVLEQGVVEHVGVSVYSPSRALQTIKTKGLSIVQIPSNILDRRFERDEVVLSAEKAGVMVYVRSAFLQGVLLMTPDMLPLHMQFLGPVVERVGMLSHELGLSRIVLALGFLKNVFPSARVIVGAETSAQIREIIAAWDFNTSPSIINRVRTTFSNLELNILDPRLWPKNM